MNISSCKLVFILTALSMIYCEILKYQALTFILTSCIVNSERNITTCLKSTAFFVL